MIDVDAIEEYFLEYKLSNFVPSSSSIRTRRMVREEAERAEHDKIFSNYTRKSRKTKLG